MVAHDRPGIAEKVEHAARGLVANPLAAIHLDELDLAGRDELILDAGPGEDLAEDPRAGRCRRPGLWLPQRNDVAPHAGTAPDFGSAVAACTFWEVLRRFHDSLDATCLAPPRRHRAHT